MVSKKDAIEDEIIGGTYHLRWLRNLSKIIASIIWADRNAKPEPITILNEIKSITFNEKKDDTTTPQKKPIIIILFAKFKPYTLFAKSVTKNAIG